MRVYILYHMQETEPRPQEGSWAEDTRSSVSSPVHGLLDLLLPQLNQLGRLHASGDGRQTPWGDQPAGTHTHTHTQTHHVSTEKQQ